ncbi:general odorant-binding protein 83a-like [Anopheles albimanus]|uniref:general odorant-binding protein 83a-like n=1 Tax=Anopheles albimanus TaxID=7167 RepID=UPI00163E9665|nr:general odorant-binding protein 83a-like [Anopheles albimanus]
MRHSVAFVAMLLLLISCVLLATTDTTTGAPIYPNFLPEQLVQQLRTARTSCLKETGTSDEEIATFNQPEPVPSQPQSQSVSRELQCYMHCMFRAFNVSKPDGHVDLVEAYHTIPKQFNSMALRAFAKCHLRVQGDDPCERAYSHHRCWKETEPAHYILL